jgi:hypothetical protein
MTEFDDWWKRLEADDVPLPYLLIDCSGFEGGAAELPREVFSELECLFTGQLAEELADVGGYLGRVVSWRHGAQVLDLLERQLASVLVMPEPEPGQQQPSFAQVHRHLRKFNVVYGPDDKPLFWRYCDPRVLGDVLGVLDAQQLAAFFGQADSLVWVGGQGEWIRAHCRGGELVLESSPEKAVPVATALPRGVGGSA